LEVFCRFLPAKYNQNPISGNKVVRTKVAGKKSVIVGFPDLKDAFLN